MKHKILDKIEEVAQVIAIGVIYGFIGLMILGIAKLFNLM